MKTSQAISMALAIPTVISSAVLPQAQQTIDGQASTLSKRTIDGEALPKVVAPDHLTHSYLTSYPIDEAKVMKDWSVPATGDCKINKNGDLEFIPGVDSSCAITKNLIIPNESPHALIFCTNNPIWSKAHSSKCKIRPSLGEHWANMDVSRDYLQMHGHDDHVSHDVLKWCFGMLDMRQVYFQPTKDVNKNVLLEMRMECPTLTQADIDGASGQQHETEPLLIKRVALVQTAYDSTKSWSNTTDEIRDPADFVSSKTANGHKSGASRNVAGGLVLGLALAVAMIML